MRVLLVALLVLAVLYALSRLRARRPPARKSAPPPAGAEAMRQCAHCGAHFPESEAVAGPGGRVFCSELHRLQHAKD